MPVESDADRAVFLNPDEFGVEVGATYRTSAGADTPEIVGLLFRTTIDVVIGDVDTVDRRAVFHCQESDLPPDAAGGDAGDKLTIGAQRFAVVDLRPDGSGMVTIILGRARNI